MPWHGSLTQIALPSQHTVIIKTSRTTGEASTFLLAWLAAGAKMRCARDMELMLSQHKQLELDAAVQTPCHIDHVT